MIRAPLQRRWVTFQVTLNLESDSFPTCAGYQTDAVLCRYYHSLHETGLAFDHELSMLSTPQSKGKIYNNDRCPKIF